ncbi:GDSL lipase/acylhydrolase [Trametes polyzona]|nr:GDSL lipase/acylhydrolase [Trametes polyzona]
MHRRPALPTVALLLNTLISSTFAALPANQISNLVTFGDSYTDVVYVADGGIVWPTYAVRYASEARNQTGGAPVTHYPLAMSGAVCSTKLTPGDYGSVLENQVPGYVDRVKSGAIPPSVYGNNTLYTLWIGTNDVGPWGQLTGQTVAGATEMTTVVDTVECWIDWVKNMYANGARNFLLQNMIPLELTPMLSREGFDIPDWTAPKNSTAWYLFTKEVTTAGNKIGELLLKDLAPTLPGAHLGLFDAHSLFADMYAHPEQYLNGTAPLNVTAPVSACHTADTCTVVEGTDKDSYLWYDPLHPSEQANRVVAQQISQIVLGEENKWTTWFS